MKLRKKVAVCLNNLYRLPTHHKCTDHIYRMSFINISWPTLLQSALCLMKVHVCFMNELQSILATFFTRLTFIISWLPTIVLIIIYMTIRKPSRIINTIIHHDRFQTVEGVDIKNEKPRPKRPFASSTNGKWWLFNLMFLRLKHVSLPPKCEYNTRGNKHHLR